MSGGRRLGLHRQARQHRATSVVASCMVVPLMGGAGTVEILLVDDEPRNLDVLESILADPAYRLLRAEDADRALRLLLDHDVAAIVLDIKMPGVSGFDLARIIKNTKRFRET